MGETEVEINKINCLQVVFLLAIVRLKWYFVPFFASIAKMLRKFLQLSQFTFPL